MRHVFQKPYVAFLLGAATIGIALGAQAAYSGLFAASGATINACAQPGKGRVYVIGLPGTPTECKKGEIPIDWNLQGPPAATGAPGTNGTNGVSPTVTPLSAGDLHCPAGGAAISTVGGTTTYVCSGQPFAGTFTSPNNQFSLSVTNSGVEISGPNTKVSLPSSGGVTVMSNGSVVVKGDQVETVANNETVTVGANRTETIGGSDNVTVGANRTETVGGSENVTVQGDRTEKVGGNATVTVGGNRTASIAGSENVTVQGNRTARVTGNEAIVINGDRTARVDNNDTTAVGANRTETVGGSAELRAGGALNFGGSFVGINGTACRAAARVGDLIELTGSSVGDILTGSSTVCIG